MGASTVTLTAIHLAVLVDAAGPAGADWRVTAVLVYDGRGYRHHLVLDPALPADRLDLGEHGQGQLRLPLEGCAAVPTSSGLTWRTFVLPSIPLGLRGLPPDRLAAAFAALLAIEAEARP